MSNSLFKIVYFTEFILITAVRSMGTAKYRRTAVKEERSSTLDMILSGRAKPSGLSIA